MADVDQALDGVEAIPLQDRPLTRFRIILVIALVAIVSRAVPFGNPVVHVDDQFYLLVGNAMLQGEWPYVDIWDRKPIGLFLIYAGIAAIGSGHDIVATHLVAGLFAAATAITIARIGELIATRRGGMLAGIAYLVCLPIFGGQTGQSPIFYNLLMSLAGLLLLQSAAAPRLSDITRRALLAMLLCGLSMTIKQVTFIEGAYFGLAFLWLAHRAGASLFQLAWRAAAMVTLALMPTAAALGVYWLAGHGEAFVFANFVSIFLKNPIGGSSLWKNLVKLLMFLPPILALGLWDYVRRPDWKQSRPLWLLLGWIVAAIMGYAFLPYFFDHYALPLMVPLCASAATLFSRRSGLRLLALLTVFSAAASDLIRFDKHYRREVMFDHIAATISRELRGGCLFIADGQTQFYAATNSCRLTPYVFPDHLSANAEFGAIGIDSITELRRIFDQQPAVVTTNERGFELRNPVAEALIFAELRAHYRQVPTGLDGNPPKLTKLVIWSRIDRERRVRQPVGR